MIELTFVAVTAALVVTAVLVPVVQGGLVVTAVRAVTDGREVTAQGA